MSEEWGPWIEHDHSGFPVPVGTIVHRVFSQPVTHIYDDTGIHSVGSVVEHISPIRASESPNWSDGSGYPRGAVPLVVRYRIRKPKGLLVLEKSLQQIAANPKQETPIPEREMIETDSGKHVARYSLA